jgi:hypothetical protein
MSFIIIKYMLEDMMNRDIRNMILKLSSRIIANALLREVSCYDPHYEQTCIMSISKSSSYMSILYTIRDIFGIKREYTRHMLINTLHDKIEYMLS